MGKKIRTAIIGYGQMGQIHEAILREIEEVELVALCDINPKLAERATDLDFFEDDRSLYEKVELDVVHICLPQYLHYQALRQATAAGVHALCADPMALNPLELQRISDLSEKYPHLRIASLLPQRHELAFQALRKFLTAEDNGALLGMRLNVSAHCERKDFEDCPWKGLVSTAGGGVLVSHGHAVLDQMLRIAGPCERLLGKCINLLDYPIEVEDTCAARLYFPSGTRALLNLTLADPVASETDILLYYPDVIYRLLGGSIYRSERSGDRWTAFEAIYEDGLCDGRERFRMGLDLSMRRFYTALRMKTDDYYHVEDVFPVCQLIDRIYYSSRYNTLVVPVKQNNPAYGV
ncbi:MAG: Gfo/Idh/MocA family oxidoreductase [Eubacteriales bacterium]|nr:Gfo/Idh/MocA family oxidoreductase [Eubacteriales bacterium]